MSTAIRAAVAACGFFLASVASALPVVDRGDVTLDPSTGLEWLDLGFTTGLDTGVVSSQLEGYLGGGWRFASTPEVLEFVENISGIAFAGSGVSSAYEGVAAAVAQFTGYSQPEQIGGRVAGWTRTRAGTEAPFVDGLVDLLGTPSPASDGYSAGVLEEFVGSAASYASWLVRPEAREPGPASVPEPSTLGALGIGLFGFAWRRRYGRS